MTSGLDARPTATAYDLEDLVTQIWKGNVRIPRFQRDFRWGHQDVLRLFDSIVRGYPIGSILLWVRPAPAERVRLGGLEIDAPSIEAAYWVVDGQQRLTSLANALHPSSAGDPTFAVSYDLRSGRFVAPRAGDDPRVVPLAVLFDLQQLLRWFAENPEVTEYFDRATAVTKSIRQFKIPAYQVENESEQVLRDIFDRMNNFGKRLSRAEVFSALYSDDEGEGLDLAGIADRIDAETRFGVIDADTVLRAVLARRGPDVAREIRAEFDDERRVHSEFPGESRDEAYRHAEEALRNAVTYIQKDIGVPHFTMLPYRYLLVVLARLFAHHSAPSPRHRILMRRWFWRAATAGPEVFKGSATGAMRALCSRVRPGDLSGSVQDLLQAVTRPSIAVPDIRNFRTNHASAKITLCSWWSRGPRDLLTGEPITTDDLARHIEAASTPAAVVPWIVRPQLLPPEHQASAAARLLLPAAFASEVEAMLVDGSPSLAEPQWVSVLASHSMTPEMLAPLADGDYRLFVELRSALLQRELSEFLMAASELEFEDTPPLADLLIDVADTELDDHSDAETHLDD